MAETKKSLFDLTKEQLPLRRRMKPALDPAEQIETQRTLEFLDHLAHRRLGDMQDVSGSRCGSIGHDDPEDLDLAEIHRVDRLQSITVTNRSAAKARVFRSNVLKHVQFV